jgi:hypothetical protein
VTISRLTLLGGVTVFTMSTVHLSNQPKIKISTLRNHNYGILPPGSCATEPTLSFLLQTACARRKIAQLPLFKMAAIETITLSSSPMRAFGSNPAELIMSSSPGLPSPNTILREYSHIRPRIETASFPGIATSALTSISAVGNPSIQQVDTIQGLQPATVEAKGVLAKKTPKPRAPRKPKVLKGDPKEKIEIVKKPRKSREKKQNDEETLEGESKVKAPRKSRAKKSDGDNQSKLIKARVTKVGTDPLAQKQSRTETEVVSKHLVSNINNSIEPTDIAEEPGLLLASASFRRSNWTPPPTAKPHIEDIPISPELECDSNAPEGLVGRKTGISEFLGKFGYVNDVEYTAPVRNVETAGIKKRKLIELVNTNVTAPLPQTSTKSKAVKKKARTITELATSAFAEDKDGDHTAPLFQYFHPKGPESSTAATCNKSAAKRRSRSPTKSATNSVRVSTLLSPQSALKHASNQEFVFGTSSQIARENSPTLLRDIQQAMRESNKVIDDPFAEDFVSPSIPRYNSFIRATSAGRDLWGAASRDCSGALMDVEVIDMTETPVVSKTRISTVASSECTRPASQYLPTPDEDVWHNIEDSPAPAIDMVRSVKSGIQAINPIELEILEKTEVSLSQKPNDCEISTSKQKTILDKSAAVRMPDYESYTTVQLSKEIASYHFKPVKSRDQMINLLGKCWEGKQRIALGNIAANCLIQASPSKSPLRYQASQGMSTLAASPKRGRGRPRKVSQTEPPSNLKSKSRRSPVKTAEPIKDIEALSENDNPSVPSLTPKRPRKRANSLPDEICDSDSPVTPSPPRRAPSQVSKTPQRLKLSRSSQTKESLTTAQEVLLQKHISLAITRAPRSQDPKNPSWHEKMLLYDPVILEDLTAWLNTGALQKVGWDGEVDISEVKKWCTERSVCSLLKINRRGDTRSRF